MTTAIVVAVVVGLLLIWLFARKRRQPKISFDDFLEAMKEAAGESERAYREQVATISRGSRTPSTRGIALARFLSALFPANAYLVMDMTDTVDPNFKRNAPFDGKGTLNLASGVALEPLGVTPAHPEFSEIKIDTDLALRTVVNYFRDDFRLSPDQNLQAALHKLAPLWNKALEASVGPLDKGSYAAQYCTSGLHLFTSWLEALRK